MTRGGQFPADEQRHEAGKARLITTAWRGCNPMRPPVLDSVDHGRGPIHAQPASTAKAAGRPEV